MQVMIENNLDIDVALYPYELVTYGESGQVCQNWMQYLLIKRYLEIMDNTPLHARRRRARSSPTASWSGCLTHRMISTAWPRWAASTTDR